MQNCISFDLFTFVSPKKLYMAKTIQQWFDEYSSNHQNAVNKSIHFICVPLIFVSLVGLLSYISITPPNFNHPHLFPYFNLAELIILASLIFYLRLSLSIFIGMAVFSLLSLGIIFLVTKYSLVPLWMVSLVVFVLAWAGQFYGHKIEGKKPSFVTDLKFLLIGPAWILGFLYKRWGIKL